jgi:hypothetical protein
MYLRAKRGNKLVTVPFLQTLSPNSKHIIFGLANHNNRCKEVATS